MKRSYRIGTRGSALALAQTNEVVSRLKAENPGVDFEAVVIKTHGDVDRATPILEMGERGVFTSGIERALLDNEVDFAVHSMKDLPSKLPEGLSLSESVPPRGRSGDVLVFRSSFENASKQEKRQFNPPKGGFTVGTGSARRKAQVEEAWPSAFVKGIRGNIDTRLGKVKSGEYDAVVLAEAGLIRLGHTARSLGKEGLGAMPLPFIPAPTQGMLGLEYRAGDEDVRGLLLSIGDREATLQYRLESLFMSQFDSVCGLPVGGRASVAGNLAQFSGYLSDGGGRSAALATGYCPIEEIGDEIVAMARKLKLDLERSDG